MQPSACGCLVRPRAAACGLWRQQWHRGHHDRRNVSLSNSPPCSHTPSHTGFGVSYVWGCSFEGRLGLGERVRHQWSPQRLGPLCGKRVAALACGYNHTIVLTQADVVYGFGANSFGQLVRSVFARPPAQCVRCKATSPIVGWLVGWLVAQGLGYTSHRESKPVRIESLCGTGTEQIACGAAHTIVVRRRMRAGAATGTAEPSSSPAVTMNGPVSKESQQPTSSSSSAAARLLDVYVFGANVAGQLVRWAGLRHHTSALELLTHSHTLQGLGGHSACATPTKLQLLSGQPTMRFASSSFADFSVAFQRVDVDAGCYESIRLVVIRGLLLC